MESDFSKSVNSAFGDVSETIRRYLVNNEVDNFIELFDRMRGILFVNVDERRKIDINNILSDAHIIYSRLLYMRSCGNSSMSYEFYAAPLASALPRIVNYSFTVEYRKLQVVLGLVSALADLLVFELGLFGYHTECQYQNTCACRIIRKSIGNGLINLTYRHTESKLKLCLYQAFLSCVTTIISDVPSLAQYYGGLIRNLSWNTDEISAKQALAQTVPALVNAALVVKDQKCRLALLSALWNLAPHSAQNKKAMCERRDFLTMLTHLLTDEPRYATLVESASGVLKYLCSYIKDYEMLRTFLIVDENIITRLLVLLNSSTFTVVVNSLGALCILSAQDSRVQQYLAQNGYAKNVINRLANSAREDVSTSAKALLDNLHSAGFLMYKSGYESDISMPAGRLSRNQMNQLLFNGPKSDSFSANFSNHSQTLDSSQRRRRNPNDKFSAFSNDDQLFYAKNGYKSFMQQPFHTSPVSTTIPRSQRGGEKTNELQYQNNFASFSQVSAPCTSRNANPNFVMGIKPQQQITVSNNCVQSESEQFIQQETCASENDELTESMQCTATGSLESLNSIQHNEEWPSTITTASNSGTQSPASGSELPDSPSQCALLSQYNQFTNLGTLGSVNGRGSSSGGIKTSDSGQTSIRTVSLKTPKNSAENIKCSTRIPTFNTHFENNKKDVDAMDERLLCDMIENVLPKPTRRLNPQNSIVAEGDKDDQLLNECIASVMPNKKHAFSTLNSAREVAQNQCYTETGHHSFTPENCSQSAIDWDDTMDGTTIHYDVTEENELDNCQNYVVSQSTQNSELHQNDHKFHDMNGDDSSFYNSMKKSSLLESHQRLEKIRDASKIQANISSNDANNCLVVSSSSDDNYNFPESCDDAVDVNLPEDVIAKFQDDPFVQNGSLVSSTTTHIKGSESVGNSSPSKSKDLKPSAIPRKAVSHRSSGSSAFSITSTTASAVSKSDNSQSTVVASNYTSGKTAIRKPPVAPKPKLTSLTHSKKIVAASSNILPIQQKQAKEEGEASDTLNRKIKNPSKSSSKDKLIVSTV